MGDSLNGVMEVFAQTPVRQIENKYDINRVAMILKIKISIFVKRDKTIKKLKLFTEACNYEHKNFVGVTSQRHN